MKAMSRFTLFQTACQRLLLFLAVLAFTGLVPAGKAQEDPEDYVSVTLDNGRWWVTCKRPVPGAAMLAVKVSLDVVRGAGFLGSGSNRIVTTVPLSNKRGAQSNGRSDSFGTVYRARVIGISSMR